MDNKTKQEALEILKSLKEDFEVLGDRTWVPEKHSINESIDNLERLKMLFLFGCSQNLTDDFTK